MNSSYIWFIVFFCIIYLMITDQSVSKAVYLLIEILRVNIEKQKWWLLNNPKNPVVKYLIWRRAIKLAKELKQELESNAK